ncbi:TIGR02206 family membrane protein [Alteribacter keqinensis]|uniref:TIGR02206 family membrane protein n=1 Tax=Alteribacter keqinensis TaxID=2483800 RepID=A0A3M7TV15_9BACI|nr:TIGR02206 family membrane protein [Alteribacter keqinensis]RNA69293.1 TIGR02206 family membrane protein [Alteribacter keqinensis]
MSWYTGNNSQTPFSMFSAEHLLMIIIFFLGIAVIYALKSRIKNRRLRKYEIAIAVSLLLFETAYHGWLITTGQWGKNHALPLELCNISLVFVIVLMLTRHRAIHSLVLFIGIAGAIQAIVTPVLSYGFPHFRFVHFFYTHILIIWVSVYFVVIHNYRPRFLSVLIALLFLNILLPVIIWINHSVNGNYWFLSEKPAGGSLLDYLGPHPWYILSLQGVAFVLFTLIWLVFKKR